MNKFIVSVLAKDRPGIIAQVSDILFDLDCNLTNVNQMILEGQFSGFFLVEAPNGFSPNDVRGLLEEKTAGSDLSIHVGDVIQETAAPKENNSNIFMITTIGPDQKGLVARFSAVMAQFDANIVNLKAVFKGGDAPEANLMSYQVNITEEVDAQALFTALRETATKLGLDIRIQHRNIFQAIHKI